MSFQGRHDQLVAQTSLEVDRGSLLLLVADAQLERTALALMLSGRMAPSAGTVSWDGSSQLKTLRARSAIIDSPQINAPEAHLKVRDVVSEDLSLLPEPFWRRPQSKKWLATHGFDHLAGSWFDVIDPLARLEILTELALANHHTDCLIFDSPDRHGIDEPTWLEHLEALTHTRRKLAVVAVVSRVPDAWQGPVLFMGQSDTVEDAATTAIPLMQDFEDPEIMEVDEGPEEVAQPVTNEPAENEPAQITASDLATTTEPAPDEAEHSPISDSIETVEEAEPPAEVSPPEPDAEPLVAAQLPADPENEQHATAAPQRTNS